MKPAILFIASLCLPLWTSACSIGGLEHEVSFPSDSAALPASEARSLTNWFINLRDGPVGIEYVTVFAYAHNQLPEELANARGASVTNLTTMLASQKAIPVRLTVSVVGKVGGVYRPHDDVVLAVQPKCASTQTCC